ncbi:MAG: restriction endonuclease [Synergistaceae bacterium]|nr:restriction endonuclease [Synergistaceae bacterium]
MPMPGAQEIRKPLLEAFRGEAPRSFVIGEILELIAEYFSINLNDLSSSDKSILRSGINEAISDLKRHKYIYNPSGSTYMITNAGREILEDNPGIITDEYLKAHRKKPITKAVEAPEIMPSSVNAPDMPGDLPLPVLDTDTEIMPAVDADTAPEELPAVDADTLPEELPAVDPDTLPEDSPAVDPDTLPEELPAVDPDTLPEELPPVDPDTLPEDLPAVDAETVPEELPPVDPDTLPEDSPAVEPETLPEELPAVDPDTLPEELPAVDADTLREELPAVDADTLPEELPAVDPDTLPEDSPAVEPDTVPEDLPAVEPDTVPEELPPVEPDTVPEDSPVIDTPEPEANIETWPEQSQETEEHTPDIMPDEPEEILDTEEVQTDTMPEDLLSPVPEEAHDDIALTETETAPAPEPEPEESPYDPGLIAAAMSSDSIDDVIARHNSELAESLLMKVAGLPSDRFEMLVIDLLSKMGYFAFQTARYTTESAGSDLIHGVILDNKTGANIYIQARKLSPGRTVGKADIQEFIDELSDKGGKGIFATTANFSENAKILANDERLMLIDGNRLANLMIANNFCVNIEKVYEIKAIDAESFSEYE